MPRFSAVRVAIGIGAAVMLLAAAALEFLHPSKVASHRPPPAAPVAAQRARADFARLPLQFEANAGQTDTRVQFVSRGPGYTVFLAGRDAVVSLRAAATNDRGPAAATVVRMQLRGAREDAHASGERPLPGKANYFIGSDASKWRTDVPTFARVRYDDVYDGIDLVYYGNQEQLEYDFIVAPGADPAQIALGFTGAQPVRVDDRGDLVLSEGSDGLRMRKPVIYQDGADGRVAVDGQYAIRASGVGFAIGDYDRSQPLVIDPVLSYSSLLGGAGNDNGYAIAVDASGSAYVTGLTESTAFPTVNAFQNALSPGIVFPDAFVAKINAAGTALEYSTFLGGSSRDFGHAVAVTANGEAVVAGYTASPNFPQQGALQGYGGGDYITGGDAFVAKLGPSGNALVYSTYVGGANPEYGEGIALDDDGNAFVVGATKSTDFPVVSAVQTAFGSTTVNLFDAFVFKINAAGSALIYSTYLGGWDDDFGHAIATDADGNAYVTGETASTNFPVQGPFQGNLAVGGKDAFVTKLDPTGTALVYSTYLGGSPQPGATGDYRVDRGEAISVDWLGRAYVAGQTGAGSAFPTTLPCLGPCGGPLDAFVARFSVDGSALELSTRFGGAGVDVAHGIAIDVEGRASIAGVTVSDDFPTVAPLQAVRLGSGDAFVVRLNASGTAFDFATYLGGTSTDTVRGLALDAVGAIYGIGMAGAADFPTVSPIQPDLAPWSGSVAVFKITMDTTPPMVTVQRPNASGERLYTGTPFLIEWTASDDGILAAFDVDASTDDGVTFVPVAGCTDLPGSARSCEWSTPGPVTSKGRIRVRATDARGSSTADTSDARFTILAGSATLAVTQPNTALALVSGTTQLVKWSHNLGAQSWVRIEASRNGGTTWEELAASVKNTSSSSGTFNWYVTGPDTAQGRVRVTWLNGPVSDASNVNFSIVTPVLTMSRPVAGTNWGWESTQTVYWSTNLGKTERVNIRLSENGGATFPFVVATNLDASRGRADVKIPSLAASTNQARLKVEWVAHESFNAVSPADFRIALPFLTLTRPAGPADGWTIGTTPTITWTHNLGTLDNVKLELSLDGGATFPILLIPSTKSDGKQKVTVQPAWVTTQGRVRVTWLHPWGFSGTSPANFPIQ